MVRKLKFHEKKLLKKVDFISWNVDNNLHELKVMKKYYIQRREDYTKWVPFNLNLFKFPFFQLQVQLYTDKSQYWLHTAGASHEHWQFKTNKKTYDFFNEKNLI